MHNRIVLSAIASLALIGCSDQLNEEDSRVAFVAVSSALTAGAAEAQTNAGAAARTGDTPAFRDSAAGTINYSYNCPGGGTAQFVGSVQASSDGLGGQAAFELATDFVGCKTLVNITVDGGMDYAASVTGTADAASVTFSMNGSLSFSGEVDGSCDIDLKFSANATQDAAGVTYSGSVCGHDASATLNVQG
jgi:hypothetical protein